MRTSFETSKTNKFDGRFVGKSKCLQNVHREYTAESELSSLKCFGYTVRF